MTKLTFLPIDYDFNQVEILKKCNAANKKLAELKGVCQTIPNSEILINTLALTEAKDSSQIESIITTYSDLCRQDINLEISAPAKEVKHYIDALKHGYKLIQENELLITRYIIEINNILQNNTGGLRNQIGTVLKNERTGAIVYEPPQHIDEIHGLMKNLEEFINQNDHDIDDLVKMAIVHHQFESIHPFFDGNGRTGRIINVLYLVLKGLLDIPVLYLSRYIIRNKDNYYKLLQETRINGSWKEWVSYILEGVEQIASETIQQVLLIREIQFETKRLIQDKLPKIYSKELLDGLFLHPYTKIEYIQSLLGITRQTASIYLSQLVEVGILEKTRFRNTYLFINIRLFNSLLK